MLQNCPLTGAGRKDDENIPEILAIVTKHCECSFFPLKFFFFFFILQYCISFAIYQNESSTGIHVFPILKPPPSSLPIPSLWVMPVHQPQASSIMHQTWTGDSFHIWYYTFQCHYPKSSHPLRLPQSPKDSSIHQCLFCCLVSVNSGSWWWTGRPGMLLFMGSQRVRHDWATDLIWYRVIVFFFPFVFSFAPLLSFLWGLVTLPFSIFYVDGLDHCFLYSITNLHP